MSQLDHIVELNGTGSEISFFRYETASIYSVTHRVYATCYCVVFHWEPHLPWQNTFNDPSHCPPYKFASVDDHLFLQ